MFFNLFSQPIEFIIWLLVIAYALTVHEFFHAWAAYRQGDTTAADFGRLTLNPLAHFDLFGFLCLLLVGFGWGKPVPFNPDNLKNKRYGPALVAFAGPLANLLSVVVFGLIFRFFPYIFSGQNLLARFFYLLIMINAALFIFNLIPIPPLDGSKILSAILPERAFRFKFYLEHYGPTVLLILIFSDILFNISIFSWLFRFIARFVSWFVGA